MYYGSWFVNCYSGMTVTLKSTSVVLLLKARILSLPHVILWSIILFLISYCMLGTAFRRAFFKKLTVGGGGAVYRRDVLVMTEGTSK